MTPADILADILALLLVPTVLYAGIRLVEWLADGVVGAIEIMTQYE